ncbi:MAG: hypothetical protein JXX14_01555 [Deltaproteobacteria bacterium]|nr:hypothetical protein [Deltaproteobacteria bacterium]
MIAGTALPVASPHADNIVSVVNSSEDFEVKPLPSPPVAKQVRPPSPPNDSIEIDVSENDNPPKGTTPTVLAGQPMIGPFSSIARFCTHMNRSQKGTCYRGRHQWIAPKPLGKRGTILHASTTLLAPPDTDGAASHLSCAVLVKTTKGWWASIDETPCINLGQSSMDDQNVALQQLRFADELGLGVVFVERSRTYTKEIDLVMDGMAATGTTQAMATQIKYCAVSQGKPLCSGWLTVSADSNAVDVLHKKGMLQVAGITVPDSGLLSSGWYFLFKPVPLVPFVQSADDKLRKSAGNGDDSLDNGIEVSPLIGPFDSIQHYCSAPPTTEAQFVQSPEDAPLHPIRCPSAIPGWRGTGTIPDSNIPGRKAKIQLFSRTDDLAGAQIGVCHVAIQSAGQWYVSNESSHCQGVIGPGQTISRRLLHLKSKQMGARSIVEIFFERQKKSVSRIRPMPTHDFIDPWGDMKSGIGLQFVRTDWRSGVIAGNQKKEAPRFGPYPWRDRETDDVSMERALYLRICSVGALGIPSCTTDIPVGCGHKDRPPAPEKLWTIKNDSILIHTSVEYCGFEEYNSINEPKGTTVDAPLGAPLLFP